MTHPKEAVEAVARALFVASDGTNSPAYFLDYATVLVDQIAPMLTARAEADIADLQHDLARYMTIAGEESERADRAEADKAAAVEAMRSELEEAKGLLIEAKVQLEEGKIKTRRNRAALIDQFFAKHNPQR
jgi:hypothetical protein